MPGRARWRDAQGASAVEYALIIAAVALVVLPAVVWLSNIIGEVLEANCQQTASQNAGTASEQAANTASCARG